MLTISKDANINYLAKIVQLGEPLKHPNADRMQGWLVDGNIVYTDLSRKQGDICVYFPLECVIHDTLLSKMNLYSSPSQNTDPNVKGYFPKQGRVRAVKLRGEPSNGFLLPFDEVSKVLCDIGEGSKYIGTEFDLWDYSLLVWKYIPQVNKTSQGPSNKNQSKLKRYSKLVPNQFRLHEDTTQLRKNIHKILPSDNISISYKLHGTSFVVGNVLAKYKPTFSQRIKAAWDSLLGKASTLVGLGYSYQMIYASRNGVKNQYESAKSQHYYSYDMWADIKDCLVGKLDQGITVYGEAVGYTRTAQLIQKDYDYGYVRPTHVTGFITRIGDKETSYEHTILGEYTEGIHYGIYIYRITSTNLNGDVIEFTTNQIIDYCKKYDLKSVPINYIGKAGDSVPLGYLNDEDWQSKFLSALEASPISHQNIDCHMCKNKVPAEGVVVRVERLNSFEAYKLKSFYFLEKETKDLDDGVIDIESEQSITEEV